MSSDRDSLPDTVKPINYHLFLYDIEFLGKWSYQGTVKIDLEVKFPAKEIVLNAHELVIHGAALFTQETISEQASSISYDENAQRVTLHFDHEFAVASKASLEIKFQGTANNHMAGFYRSRYKPAVEPVKSVPRDDEWYYMFSTHFESSHARRAFPNFDEPNLKATFDFAIEIPNDQKALYNMPEKATSKSAKDGWKIVSFERTPIMSTYLLAWAFGDFGYVEDFTRRKYNGKSLPVRVYATKGLENHGRYALETAHLVVDYFSEIFGIDYPLPKLDLIAVHEFAIGAMENWGLLTYRTTALLFDEAQSDQRFKTNVAYIVSHELAHQWFGNLVTMDWWNELWLKEGFATWVGWVAIDKFHPEWNVWAQFCANSLQNAFRLDSIRGSHPIEVPVRNALEVDQIFDHISYLKGSSIIRMLSTYLEPNIFLLGVSNYLKAHEYSNATCSDLWSALSDASKQDVNSFMEPWIREIGFPLVTITEEPGQITATQSRFLNGGDVKPEDDKTVWWIPLGLKTGTGASSAVSALTVKSDTIYGIDDTFYKLNSNSAAFYRIKYPRERLKKLGENRHRLSTEDKIGLIGDAAAVAYSGDGTTTAYLALIEPFRDENDFLVWSQILSSLSTVQSVFADIPEISEGLRKFTLSFVEHAVEKIGWEFAPGEDLLTGRLRSLLISTAGGAGHEATVAEAKRRFDLVFSGKDSNAIHPSLRLAVFQIVIGNGGKEEYEAVKGFYNTTTSVDGKEIALRSLGCVKMPELAKDLLHFTFSPAVSLQDRGDPAISLAANSKVRLTLWEFIKENWDSKIYRDMSGNTHVLEGFLRKALSQFASFEVERDIFDFFKDKNQKGYDRGLRVVKDTITSAARYKERDSVSLKAWLAGQ